MKEIFERNKKIIGVGIIMILITGFMLTPTTMEIGLLKKEKYVEPYTTNEKYIIEYQEPIYKTVINNIPINTTLNTYRINKDIIKNVYKISENDYPYAIIVYYYDEKYNRKYKDYYDIYDYIIVDSYNDTIGYNNKSEQIVDGYVKKEITKNRTITNIRTLEREITVIKTIDCRMYETIFGLNITSDIIKFFLV